MKKLVAWIIFPFLFLWHASEAQTDLSLADALRIGLDRNFDIQIERKNISVAQNNNSWGEAGRFPSVSANVSQNNSINDNIKTATPFQLQDKVASHSVTPGITLNWTLFNGFRVNISKERLARLEQESEGNVQIIVTNTLQAIILGYYNAVFEKERLEELSRQLNLSRDRYKYVKIKNDLGTAVISDLLLEETNYLTDSINFINQRLLYRNSIRNLNVLLAEPDIDRTYNITDPLSFEDIDFKYEELIGRMNRDNVDLRQQYIMQSILQSDRALRRADRYPSLELQSGYTDSRSRVDLSRAFIPTQEGNIPGPQEPLSAVTDTYFANLTLSFTLFNGRRINRAIKNAIIQEDIGNLRIERLRTTLNRDLLSAMDDYATRKQVYGISEKRYATASTNLQFSEERFKNGTINSFDYRIVQSNLLAAANQRLLALYNLIDAQVTILRLSGGIIESYIE